MGKKCLPESLRDAKHTDFPWPLKWVPRSWTAFCWDGPPTMLFGNQKEKRIGPDGRLGPAPIGEPSSFQVSWPLYFAFSLGKKKDGKFRHFRVGFRWDDVWGAYILSLATRRYTGERIEDTSTS